ncbi:MAG: proton-conducting transporter membrane subunit [Flavobacteriia bacterium]|nr:proton-conducting transporter membrane subunit [Flavobacteriia bacterium]
MEKFIHLFILLPIVAFIISVMIPKKQEGLLSRVAFVSVGVQFLAALLFLIFWFEKGVPHINLKEFSIYKAYNYDFFIDFYVDRITLVYLFLGSLITFVITVYSRCYLHREEGYKRFFNTILFFYSGYNIIIFAGNIETLFIGWEILGISSFLLIAFYRDRYLPVKNAVKVFSIYRIGDVGIILAMWLSHHLWHENITFLKLNNVELVHHHLADNSLVGLAIALMIFISASAKSAQLPFSSWLPRAMEGPTPSSAVFYGSLSVHIGAFLLMRTYPFWEYQTIFKIILVISGALTAIIATFISRVQSSIKSQIAYSSIAQIGLIFIEIAFGLEVIALIHISGNAFLRTYQLLISPSVVSYKIREQLYEYKPRIRNFEDSLPKRIENTIFILSLKEWNLDSLMYRYLWNPVKRIGGRWTWMNFKYIFYVIAMMMTLGIVLLYFSDKIDDEIKHYLPLFFSLFGFLIAIKAFSERDSVRKSWTLILFNHFAIAIAISFNEHFDWMHHVWYLSGVIVSWFLGLMIINYLRKREVWISLNQFHGHSFEHPKAAFLFLLCCLGFAGFPITPTFIGEDLIFSHIHYHQVSIALFTALSLIINGLATIRIYARIFLGPHVKNYHEVAKRSS